MATKKPTKRKVKAPSPAVSNDLWLSDPHTIKQFLAKRQDYEQLCAEVEYTLRRRVGQAGIETSAITSRAKTLNSFIEKIQRKQYDNPFAQITDFAGVRVVCLYQSDVPKVADIILKEFKVAEDIDKLGALDVDQFGYSARHFIVRLGEGSSGARYDDLKNLPCEIQVRTVVQDAWSIIQHHIAYKRESQIPTKLQRKLNSLSGLFETVDDQFERIREEREAYIREVELSKSEKSSFLDNEVNLDSFKEYLKWKYPERAIETWDGQARMVFEPLAHYKIRTLRDVDAMLIQTEQKRKAIGPELKPLVLHAKDGSLPSNLEVALAIMLLHADAEEFLRFSKEMLHVIDKHRKDAPFSRIAHA